MTYFNHKDTELSHHRRVAPCDLIHSYGRFGIDSSIRSLLFRAIALLASTLNHDDVTLKRFVSVAFMGHKEQQRKKMLPFDSQRFFKQHLQR